jgi:hypothetical protein
MISKWEAAGANVCPRPVNQAVLDSALAHCDDLEQSRFELLLGNGRGAEGFAQSAEYRLRGVS